MQDVEFLGVILTSINMTVSLPNGKIKRFRDLGQSLLRRNVTSIHDFSSSIGQLVFAGIAVTLAPLRYRYLEICRNMALIRSRGDCKPEIYLDEHARDLFAWWGNNLHSKKRSLRSSHPNLKANRCFYDRMGI